MIACECQHDFLSSVGDENHLTVVEDGQTEHKALVKYKL